jgi:cytochrome c oxidase assembly protein subunit 11
MSEVILPEPLPREVIEQRNKRTLVVALSVVAGMVGLAYASVPLYDLFCRVTGFGGTTQVAEEAA